MCLTRRASIQSRARTIRTRVSRISTISICATGTTASMVWRLIRCLRWRCVSPSCDGRAADCWLCGFQRDAPVGGSHDIAARGVSYCGTHWNSAPRDLTRQPASSPPAPAVNRHIPCGPFLLVSTRPVCRRPSDLMQSPHRCARAPSHPSRPQHFAPSS
jgi:hypothetical protein